MQWSTLLATAVGTVLGVVATLVADQARWRAKDRSEFISLRRSQTALPTLLFR